MKKIRIILCILTLICVSIVSNKVKADELVDDGAEITSAQIIQTKTGTGPWDDDDEPGNDSSEDNDIVRSFDQVTWTIENTMGIKNQSAESYTGGKIYFEAEVPDVFDEDTFEWDLDAMGWIEEPTISEDKRTLSGYYQMSTSSITIPGKQTLSFTFKVLGARNGIEFEPEFRMWLNGNEEKVSVKSKKITTSAKGKYNVRLFNTGNDYYLTLNEDGNSVKGKVKGYTLLVQLYNEKSAKGLKGIEYPSGDFTFDINLKFERGDNNGKNVEDISDDAGFRIYNYTPNGNNSGWLDKSKKVIGINWGDMVPNSKRPIYTSTTEDNVERSIYNSGNIAMTQDGNTVHVTLKNYKFDGRFPHKRGSTWNNSIYFSDNIGGFSTFSLQVFVEDNDETNKSDMSYWLDAKVDNMNATTISNDTINTQMVTSDDENKTSFVMYKAGSYFSYNYIRNWNKSSWLHSAWNRGDSVAYKNTKFSGQIELQQSSENTMEYQAVKGINVLYKFDTDGFEILPEDNKGNKFESNNSGKVKYNMYYAAKKDGSKWSSISEMNNADYGDLKYYNTLDELYADGNEYCVAALFETYECNWFVPDNESIRIYIPLKIRDTAEFGTTYQETSEVQFYNRKLDRTKESMMVENGAYDSTGLIYNKFPKNYIKTEYDENGVQKSGTHNGPQSGNSLLVIGTETIIKNEIVTTNEDDSVKTSYDMGRSEYDVKYKLTPSLTSSYVDAEATTATVRIKDVLPKGLTYVPNSSNYMEPEITTNDDGSTTLTWYKYDAVVNEAIDPITFDAHISEESTNGQQYTTIATVFAGDIDKRKESLRQSSNTITIVNLASHRLFKTVEKAVVEKNEEVHFTVSYKNNTDSTIPNFQLLDILPYNGDSRGTSFNGTYTLDRLVVTQEDTDGNTLSNDNLTILYTDDESARSANSKDTNLGENWNEVSTEDINQAATAFCVKGEVGSQGKVTADIYLKPNGNKGLDKYVNSSTAQVYTNTEEMQTSNVIAQVIQRKLEGIAWLDNNANGVQDSDEEVVKNIDVTLTDENGEQVKDVDGEVISSVKTDENGYYSFVDLPKGKYYVKVSLPSDKYMLTEKQVGSNTTINSKFNVESSETDEITKLNTADLPELTVSNVNAGYVKKPTKVIVNHVEVGTNKKLLDEETIDGRIDDSYETTNKLDEVNEKYSNKYKYVRVDGNETGVMTEDTIYITYYYEKVYGSLKITKVDKNNNETKIKGATYKLENDEGYSKELTTDENGEVLFDNLEIGKYTLTETQAPSGYELEGKSKEIEITQANKDVEVIASDRLRIVLPDTGRINCTIAIILSGIVIVSISILVKNIIKNTK